ncbi:MAG: hypothetical protein AB1638_09190 [Nitrospirota bacterium]
MINIENIKTFVKKTLGCSCPEEVFKYIDCQSNIKLNDDILLSNKINIGNRLLIYVVQNNDQDTLKDVLPLLVNTGKKERDDLRFNRFRLVIATDKLSEIKENAEIIFQKIEKDEKIHLHIVSKKDIPVFLKPG